MLCGNLEERGVWGRMDTGIYMAESLCCLLETIIALLMDCKWVLVTQSCLTLCDHMDYSLPGPSVHGILQARILEWVAIPFSRGSSRPRIESESLALQADSLPSEPPGKPNSQYEIKSWKFERKVHLYHVLDSTYKWYGEGNGNPLQYSCLENPMDRGAWWATVHGVAKSWTQLSDFTFLLSIVSFGEGTGNPLQCSCLENPMDGGAWSATVYGVAKSRTWRSNQHTHT